MQLGGHAMNASDHAGQIANEVDRERRYATALEAKARNRQRLANQSVNNTLTTPVDVRGPMDGDFVGRVALTGPNSFLYGDKDFYVGTTFLEGEGFVVYNWAAPISACTYYRQRGITAELRDLSKSVAAVRVFARSGNRIADFEDEVLQPSTDGEHFAIEALQVPRAPGRPATPTTSPTRDDTRPSEPRTTQEQPTQTRPILVPPVVLNTAPVATRPLPPPPGPPLRTPDLLRRQLAAPKAVSMAAVLSTLQTDQYEAIAKPASETQFLQGHPGTGKTIIAAHRAAFMLNGEAPSEARPRGRVLILGPTDEYVTHISAALGRLIEREDQYRVRSMPEFLDSLAGVPSSAAATYSLTYNDVSEHLARLVDKAYSRAKRSAEGDLRPTRDEVYSTLINFLQDPPPPALEGEWATYLRDTELPRTFAELRRQRIRRFRGLMSYIGVLVEGRGEQIGHIIVDEAQDIHPIEWEVLGRLGNTGGWTILGDLNQRRTDHTYPSWDAVAGALALEDETGRAPVTVLERGYRSTAQIIRFANQLLSREDRVLYSLQQDGEAPLVRRVPSRTGLIQASIEEAESLSARVGPGTVAVIGTETEAVRRHLLNHGWKADSSEASTWLKDGKSLRLLPPDRARGLEFDGVVVIEPAAFPENVGRQGVLYTALTRANRHLTVVHTSALPGGMKARP
jgi:hypothetical protein